MCKSLTLLAYVDNTAKDIKFTESRKTKGKNNFALIKVQIDDSITKERE